MYDALGRVVLHKQINAVSAEPLLIDVESLPAGIYMIRTKGSGFEDMKKMIKQ
jgi:hypothetical protein